MAVETMINNNKSVKLCVLKEANKIGSVPKVRVKITITSSGAPSSVRPVGDYAGTELGTCLITAIGSITFPPFDGDPQTITWAI